MAACAIAWHRVNLGACRTLSLGVLTPTWHWPRIARLASLAATAHYHSRLRSALYQLLFFFHVLPCCRATFRLVADGSGVGVSLMLRGFPRIITMRIPRRV